MKSGKSKLAADGSDLNDYGITGIIRMISPETTLYIYEIQGDPADYFEAPPPSFIGIWNEDDFCYVFFTDSQDEYVERILGPDTSRLSSRHEVQYCDWQDGLPAEGLEIEDLRFVPANHACPAGRLDFIGSLRSIRRRESSHHNPIFKFFGRNIEEAFRDVAPGSWDRHRHTGAGRGSSWFETHNGN